MWGLGFCSRDHTPEMRGFDEFYGSYGSNVDGFSFERDGIIDNNQWDFENGTFTQAGFKISETEIRPRSDRVNQSENEFEASPLKPLSGLFWPTSSRIYQKR